jgi:hypothetical protein
MSCVTPGLRHRTRDVRGRASRPQGIERERARRLTGGSLRFHTTQGVTRTPSEHGRPRCKRCLRPNRRVTELTARPVIFHPYRRGTPGGCSRDFEEILGSPGFASSSARPADGDNSGYWRMARHVAVQQALSNAYFDSLGLPRLAAPPTV